MREIRDRAGPGDGDRGIVGRCGPQRQPIPRRPRIVVHVRRIVTEPDAGGLTVDCRHRRDGENDRDDRSAPRNRRRYQQQGKHGDRGECQRDASHPQPLVKRSDRQILEHHRNGCGRQADQEKQASHSLNDHLAGGVCSHTRASIAIADSMSRPGIAGVTVFDWCTAGCPRRPRRRRRNRHRARRRARPAGSARWPHLPCEREPAGIRPRGRPARSGGGDRRRANRAALEASGRPARPSNT